MNSDKHNHQKPEKDAECLAFYIDIDESNYCEYQSSSGKWYPSPYCDDVVKHLVATQFEKYRQDCDKCTCKRQMRRFIERGPPIWLSDQALPVEDGEHITNVWFSSENTTESAKLTGALVGQERKELWNHYKVIFEILDEEDE